MGWLAGFACCVLLLQTVAPAAPVAEAEAPAAQASAAVEHYRELVTQLASERMEGRGPGTKGLDLARDYLAAAFREAGLKPAFEQGKRFTQPFRIPLTAKVEDLALSLTSPDGAAVEADALRDVVAIGMSESGEFSAPLVFVGYGVVNPGKSYDSYAAAAPDALRGKVALVLRYEPLDDSGQSQWATEPGRWSESAALVNKAKWAAERGAVALLLVNPPGAPGAQMLTTGRSAAGSASIPMLQVTAAWLKQAAPQLDLEALQKQADREPIVQALDHVAHGKVRLVRPQAQVDNLAGVIAGVGALADEVVVMCAHYDHLGYGEIGSLMSTHEPTVHHGADDNASGTAAVVLAARELARQVGADASTPRRTILIVAFTAEERGLLGAFHLLENLADTGFKLEQLTAVVNLDMVGRMRDRTLYVTGYGTGEGLGEIVQRAGAGLDVKIEAQNVAPGGSDHVAFHLKGVPGVHMFTGSHPDYHRPSDTAEKINLEGGVAAARYAEQLTHALATLPQRVAFVASEAFAHGGGAGGPSGGAVLGVMPDYGSLDGDDGAVITGVMPGSAAMEAGLLEGDIIVGWDETRVTNVRLLTELLRQAQPGQSVELTVRRASQTVKLTAKLRQRG